MIACSINQAVNSMAVDARGVQFAVGQQVARAAKLYRVDGLYVKICEVTRVEGDAVYLDGSAKPINFPERLAIIEGAQNANAA